MRWSLATSTVGTVIDTTTVGSMPVGALIGGPVTRVDPDMPVTEVAQALTTGGIGAVVVGDGDTVSGIVSERDVTHAVAAGLDLAATSAIDIAHTSLLWCDLTATVAEVASEMMDQWVRHILVEEDGQLVGIVSARDLLGVYATAEEETD